MKDRHNKAHVCVFMYVCMYTGDACRKDCHRKFMFVCMYVCIQKVTVERIVTVRFMFVCMYVCMYVCIQEMPVERIVTGNSCLCVCMYVYRK